MSSFPLVLNYLKAFKVFCVFPVTFNVQLQRYEKQPLRWFYLSSLAFMFGVHSCTILKLAEELTRANGSQQLRLGLKISQQLMALSIIVSCYFSRESLKNTMNLFLQVDRVFKENMVQLNYKQVPLLAFVALKHLASAALIVAMTGCCCVWNDSMQTCFFYTWEHFFNFQVLTHISTSLCALLILAHQRFVVLNLSTTNVALKGHLKRSDSQRIVVFNAKAPEVTLNTITRLHFKVTKSANLASETYSYQLLIIFSFTLLRIVENMHYAYIDSKSNLMAFIVELFWLILIVIDSYITFLIATNVETMAGKTTRIASMICCGDNLDLQVEKNMFLLQSYHQPVHLQAGGIYPLKNESFLKLWGAALTYIILMQGLNRLEL